MLKIETLITGPFQVCTYIVFDEGTKEAIIIDPGDADPQILKIVQEYGLKVKFIFGTHGHPDHLLGVDSLRQALKAPFILHKADEFFFRDPQNFSVFKNWGFPANPRADGVYEEGFEITLGDEVLVVIHTPGHSPGSSCLYAKGSKAVFTGDTLFVQGVGRADLPGGNYLQMLRSIRDKLFLLPDDTIVYPGHDYGPKPTSTIAEEKRLNPFVQELDL
jgi:hydroxyacylglutathione hydrolase